MLTAPQLLDASAAAAAHEKAVIVDYNAKLTARAAVFAAANAGVRPAQRMSSIFADGALTCFVQVTAHTVDTNTFINGLLDAPQKNGFVDATSFGDAPGVMWCMCPFPSPTLILSSFFMERRQQLPHLAARTRARRGGGAPRRAYSVFDSDHLEYRVQFLIRVVVVYGNHALDPSNVPDR